MKRRGWRRMKMKKREIIHGNEGIRKNGGLLTECGIVIFDFDRLTNDRSKRTCKRCKKSVVVKGKR